MATTKIKGYNLTMSGIAVGKEVSCSATLTNNLEEAEWKDPTNPMNPDQTVTSKSWTMQQELSDLSALADLRALITAALSTTPQAVSMSAAGSAVLSGSAYVSDLNIQAPNRGNTRATVQFQGTGALS